MKKLLSNALLCTALGAAILAAPAAMAQAAPGAEPAERGLTRDMAIHAAMERFDRADKDADGILSREEMREAAKHMRDGFGRPMKGPHDRTGAEGDRRGGDRADASQRQEEGHDQDRGRMRPKTLPFHIDQGSDQGDGMVKTWRKAEGDFGKDREGRVKAFFERFDADGDGVISKDEMSDAKQDREARHPRPPVEAPEGAPQD